MPVTSKFPFPTQELGKEVWPLHCLATDGSKDLLAKGSSEVSYF